MMETNMFHCVLNCTIMLETVCDLLGSENFTEVAYIWETIFQFFVGQV